jgi:hypothetical protein
VAQGVGPEFKPQKRKERKSSRQSPHIVWICLCETSRISKSTEIVNRLRLGMVVHACNPSTQQAEMGGLQVPGQPEPHRDVR